MKAPGPASGDEVWDLVYRPHRMPMYAVAAAVVVLIIHIVLSLIHI